MTRTLMAFFIPPAAVARYGCASCTAAPIGVFWLTSLVAIVYWMMGGKLDDWEASRWFIIWLGCMLWVIAAVWSRLVIRGVDDDLGQGRESSLKRRVIPHPDEADPLNVLRDSD